MGGKYRSYDWSLDARDAKMAKVKTALNLAMIANNQPEITRLTKQLKKLGQSW